MISEELFNPAQLFWMYDLCSELWTWKLRSIYNQCHVHPPVQCFSKLVDCFLAFTWSGILVMMIPDQLMFLHGLNRQVRRWFKSPQVHHFDPFDPFGSPTVARLAVGPASMVGMGHELLLRDQIWLVWVPQSRKWRGWKTWLGLIHYYI